MTGGRAASSPEPNAAATAGGSSPLVGNGACGVINRVVVGEAGP